MGEEKETSAFCLGQLRTTLYSRILFESLAIDVNGRAVGRLSRGDLYLVIQTMTGNRSRAALVLGHNSVGWSWFDVADPVLAAPRRR